MAPSQDTHACRVHVGQIVHRPVARRLHVVDLAAPVVDRVVELRAVPRAAAVFRRNHHVALLQQLTKDVRVVAVERAMHVAVHQDQQRRLAGAEGLGREGVDREAQWVARALSGGVGCADRHR